MTTMSRQRRGLAPGVITAALAVMAASLVGCTGAADPGTPIEEQLARRNLQLGGVARDIQNSRIDGWNSLDDRNLIVQAGPNTQYLVTLLTYCQGLRGSETVGFSTTGTRVTAFDTLVVRGAGDIIERCPIDSIHELEPLTQP